MAADVVPFDRSRRRTDRGPTVVGDAEILIFTGVRYEHTDHGPANDPAGNHGPSDPVNGGTTTRRRI